MGRVSKVAFWGRKNKEAEPETRENKKAGPIRRLWRKLRNIDWKNPVNRWKLLFVSLIGCIVVFGGGYGVLAFTNSPSFCSSCHEMQPEYTTYTASAHDQISCVQCHIKPGTINMLTHKMKSLKEVYYHVTGVPKQIVQTEEEAVSNQNCLQCHSLNRDVTPSGDLKVNHKKHIQDGIPCITCHSGVVHAKIAARDINVEADRSQWTTQTVNKLVEEKYLRPNMGTCIDCHNKVNKGEKPWKDPAYSVPPNPEETAPKTEEKGKNTTELKGQKATQEIILESLNQPVAKELKVSMECSTCHSEISMPKDHRAVNWNSSHGTAAVQKLDQCFSCHQDSKWTKTIPKEDIMTLLKLPPKGQKYVANLNTAKEEARTSTFCNTCHAERPSGHSTSDQWLTGHASQAKTNEQKAECYVCHDRSKPTGDAKTAKAPTDVYCENCHRTGFKGETKK